MCKNLITMLTLVLFCSVKAQTIKGTLVNSVTDDPIVGAIVYIPSTTIQAKTNTKGIFELTLPQAKAEVTFYAVGYKSFLWNVVASSITNKNVIIKLEPSQVVEEVLVTASNKFRASNVQTFKDQFLGTAAFRSEVIIKDDKNIKLNFYPDTKELIGYGNGTFVINNNALGYDITYDLNEFAMDFNSNVTFYKGFPLFSVQETTKEKKRKYFIKNRQTAYNGSLMQFVRLLYDNKLDSTVYRLNFLEKVINPKKRILDSIVKKIKESNLSFEEQLRKMRTLKPESDSIYLTVKANVKKQDFVTIRNEVEQYMHTPYYLQIIYLKESESQEFVNYTTKRFNKPRPNPYQDTYIQFLDGEVEIFSNGYIDKEYTLLLTGYMGFEKMSYLLPLDYVEEDKQKL